MTTDKFNSDAERDKRANMRYSHPGAYKKMNEGLDKHNASSKSKAIHAKMGEKKPVFHRDKDAERAKYAHLNSEKKEPLRNNFSAEYKKEGLAMRARRLAK